MILNRRRFLEGLPALLPAGLAAAPEESPRSRFYVFEQYFLEQGSQPGRIHDFFSKALLPAMERLHKGPKIFLEALFAPHMPQAAVFFGVETCDQVFTISQALFADKDFSRAFDQWDSGEPPYVSASASLLEVTEYSPEIVAPAKPLPAPRVFELRAYHSTTARQAKALHERFAGPEMKAFQRAGIHPILCTSTVFGTGRPSLTYLTPFDTPADREKAWNAFTADPEWLKARQESIDRSGQIVAVQNISMYRAMPYSPIR